MKLKKRVCVIALIVFTFFSGWAQQINEPEFVGEVFLLSTNYTVTPLPKHLVKNKVNVPASAFVGVGRVKNNIVVDGCCSSLSIPKEKQIELIVKAVDNASDPLSIIRIFKFKKNKKNRTAEVASANMWGSVKKNNLDYVPFTAVKYGESSYLVKIEGLADGQYGIMVTNPNALDQKETVVSTFSID